MTNHRPAASLLLLSAMLASACCSSGPRAGAVATPSAAPVSPEARALYDEIARVDRALFDAFNAHDLSRVKKFFADDMEMYHDTGGLLSFADVVGGTESNFAKDNGLRRDLVPGTLEVYPIRGYGAIETGAHTFCHREDGRDDCGTFKFLHVWRRRDGQWQITRAVSYDH